ncbi:hypothetical protein [Paenibacillus macerans]|uniref:hypothetical protein n=1 Tax=Paenibacillus macerans TaxID=44252 RepID=UPI003D31F033
MFKKIFFFFLLTLLLVPSVSAFADSPSPKSDNIASEGYFIGGTEIVNGNTKGNSTNQITPQEVYYGTMTVAAKKVGTSTLEANWNFSGNDYVYSAYLTAVLQYYSTELRSWVDIDYSIRSYSFNPSSENVRGQFNFYSLDDGEYRVVITGSLTARNTVFNNLSSAKSNSVFFGFIDV